MLDVLVVGAGPAGRSVAAACAERGLRTELLDPAPGRPWRATYGAWHDELPATLPLQVIAASARGRAIARTEHDLGRNYAVLDTAELRGHLDARLRHAGVAVRRGLVRAGEVPAAAVVLDAGGAAQPLAAGPHGTGVAAEQTAAGVVVPATSAAPLVAPGQALFMDWRPVNGAPGLSFLYAVPVGPGEVLLEETSLARRPGLDLAVLTRRLHTRLDRHGIRVPATARREMVRFPLDRPRHRGRQALGFGAAAPLTHPATGYQLATALRLAVPVADAIATGLARGPAQAAHAVDAVLWPPGAGSPTSCAGAVWSACCAWHPSGCRTSSKVSSDSRSAPACLPRCADRSLRHRGRDGRSVPHYELAAAASPDWVVLAGQRPSQIAGPGGGVVASDQP